MLRSFNYARWNALRGLVAGSVDFERVAPLARAWEAEARKAFVGAYNAAAGAVLTGSAAEAAQGLLGFRAREGADKCAMNSPTGRTG